MYLAEKNRYDSMRYKRVGKSGLKLPYVSLGLWHNFGSQFPHDNSREMVLGAFDLGEAAAHLEAAATRHDRDTCGHLCEGPLGLGHHRAVALLTLRGDLPQVDRVPGCLLVPLDAGQVVREHAGIPDDQVIMKAVAMGWPDESFPANAVVSERKSLDEAARFVGFD